MLSKITKKKNFKTSICYDDDQTKYTFISPPVLDQVNNSYIWKDVDVKISKIKKRGFGLFAKKNLKKNTLIPYGGILVENITNLAKNIDTSSYLVSCGENCTGPWRDGNPTLLENQPELSWVGIYVNEPNVGKKETHNADLFTWMQKKVVEIPDYPFTDNINSVFIRIVKPILKGDEIFVHYYWTKAQQKRRGYTSKLPDKDLYYDKNVEVIQTPKKREPLLPLVGTGKIRLLKLPSICAESRLKKKVKKASRYCQMKLNFQK